MLSLSDAFFERAEERAIEQFIARNTHRLLEERPHDARLLGFDGMQDAVRVGIHRASCWGIDQESAVETYLSLMFYLGFAFDADPTKPWARTLLSQNGARRSQSHTINKLRAQSLQWLMMTHGENGEYRAHSIKGLRRLLASSNDFSGITEDFGAAWPQMYIYFGGEGFRKFNLKHREEALRVGLRDEVSIAVSAWLRVLFGYWSLSDGRLPWVQSIFSLPPTQRGSSLRQATQEHWWYIEEHA